MPHRNNISMVTFGKTALLLTVTEINISVFKQCYVKDISQPEY
jgi:hypothetical protein